MPKPYIPKNPGQLEIIGLDAIMKSVMNNKVKKQKKDLKKRDIPRWELQQDLLNKLRDKPVDVCEKELFRVFNKYESEDCGDLFPILNEVASVLNQKRKNAFLAKKLEHYKALSLVDDLIDSVFNYRFFNRTLKDQIKISQRYSNPLSMMIWDIDDFKKINDTYGHPGGDYVLKTVVERAYDGLRGEDILSRMGGDEFSTIIPDADEKTAGDISIAVKSKIQEKPIVYYGNNIFVKVSVGYDQYRGMEQTEFHRKVDELSYISKKLGKDCIAGPLGFFRLGNKEWKNIPEK